MSQNHRETNNHSFIFIGIGVAILFSASYFVMPFVFPDKRSNTQPAVEISIDSQSNTDVKDAVIPTIKYAPKTDVDTPPPVDEAKTSQEKPSPESVHVYQKELYSSDKDVLDQTKQLISNKELQSYISTTNIISNFVVFTDNIAKGEFLAQFSPLNKPISSFQIENKDGQILLNPKSYQRYTPYAEMISNVDIDMIVKQYNYFKPLIDSAYQEMGYDVGDFDSTLIDAINVLLDAPVIRYPIELKAPSAMYLFQNNYLESLNNAQKLLIRMGPDNTLLIQNKLKKIKNVLAKQ